MICITSFSDCATDRAQHLIKGATKHDGNVIKRGQVVTRCGRKWEVGPMIWWEVGPMIWWEVGPMIWWEVGPMI